MTCSKQQDTTEEWEGERPHNSSAPGDRVHTYGYISVPEVHQTLLVQKSTYTKEECVFMRNKISILPASFPGFHSVCAWEPGNVATVLRTWSRSMYTSCVMFSTRSTGVSWHRECVSGVSAWTSVTNLLWKPASPRLRLTYTRGAWENCAEEEK